MVIASRFFLMSKRTEVSFRISIEFRTVFPQAIERLSEKFIEPFSMAFDEQRSKDWSRYLLLAQI